MFLAGTGIILLPAGAGAADVLAQNPAGAALVIAPDVPAFLAAAARRHLPVHAAGTISGFNYSRGRPAALSLFLADSPSSPPAR